MSDERTLFEARAQSGVAVSDICETARRARAGDEAACRALAAAFAHCAFAAPSKIAATYDAAADGWLGCVVKAPAIAAFSEGVSQISTALWRDFWALVDGAAPGIGAGEITTRTAALGGLLASDFREHAIDAISAFPGVLDAAGQGIPPRFQLADLAACPEGSLGHTFYRLIVDNNFDLEVLDRDVLGLSGLPQPLGYVNARVLQSHDLWHITAGYETTKLHEVAISAFQLAQFGHTYSAMFLAVVTASTAFRAQPAFALLTELILTAWVHGRTTPPMLGINWESLWHLPTDEVRARCGIAPYQSPYPADLAEQLETAA
ncbi:MAG: hypothetical protein GC166_11470 [Alphaproteobacteria bacterium]|nr:hypothetical protein [Alphaproteobacteria bacterium]